MTAHHFPLPPAEKPRMRKAYPRNNHLLTVALEFRTEPTVQTKWQLHGHCLDSQLIRDSSLTLGKIQVIFQKEGEYIASIYFIYPTTTIE